MSGRLALTRRALLASLGTAMIWRPAEAAPERPRDVGIGGTGFAPEGSAGPRQTARNRIHMAPGRASQLLLPVAPACGFGLPDQA